MLVLENRRKKNTKIASYLVFEEIDGFALPYKGYKEVILGNKTPDDIIDSSALQAVLVSLIHGYLFSQIDRKNYILATNESGLHINKGTNLSNDIAIFRKLRHPIKDQYFDVAPIIAIEVDTKVDLSDTPYHTDTDYIISKSKKLLDFGAEKVVWVLTKEKKIVISALEGPWTIVDFDHDILIMEDCILNLHKLMLKEDIVF